MKHPERRNDAAFRRFRRTVTFLLVVQAFGLATALGVGYNENRERIRDLCVQNQTQNDGIVAYLKDLGATPPQIAQARKFFPERDCG